MADTQKDATATETAAPVEPLPEGHVEVVVVTPVSGLRNGQPWPAPGESFVIPEAEAQGYLQFGYVKLPDPE